MKDNREELEKVQRIFEHAISISEQLPWDAVPWLSPYDFKVRIWVHWQEHSWRVDFDSDIDSWDDDHILKWIRETIESDIAMI